MSRSRSVDVAREAEGAQNRPCSNYFQTKDHLGTHRSRSLIQDELSRRSRTLHPNHTAIAIRPFVLANRGGTPASRSQWRGELATCRHHPHRPPSLPGASEPPATARATEHRRDRRSSARIANCGNRWPAASRSSITEAGRRPARPKPEQIRRELGRHRSGPRRPRRLAYFRYGPAQHKPPARPRRALTSRRRPRPC